VSFAIYLIGYLILIGGLVWAATLLKVSGTWIGVGVVILVGIGILSGVAKTRHKDPPA
jgi:hypothetical protein